MSEESSIAALAALGFTGLEAEVYTFLLQESPATGYRIAQATAKPAANIYKAIESLVNKGGVIVEEGASRLCRAVPAEELLAGLERSFAARRAAAERALAELRKAPEDDSRVYRLTSRAQVLERCRSMLARAEQIALVDAFPGLLLELRPEIEAAAARGVKVALQAYAPIDIDGARTNYFPDGAALVASYPGQWVIVVADAMEHLLALMPAEGDAVHHAVWSGSAFVSWALQAFMTTEFLFAAVLADPATPAGVRDVLRGHRAFYPGLFEVRGYRALVERYGVPYGRRKREDVEETR
jgi:sugar-specific transcriptional regulator TrmB